MPTRHGWMLAVAGIATLVIARVFGIIELYVIATGMLGVVVLAVVIVQLRRPQFAILRWAHPSTLTVGETGRVDLLIQNRRRSRSPAVDITEPVGTASTARMSVVPLRARAQVTASYRVPTSQRGVIALGPTMIERSDLLGLASTTSVVTGTTDVIVAPQAYELPMPALGAGVLGRHLLALSQRIGPGEFHSLRDYVSGDEPRNIHWRASARSDDLKVRQHEAQGVRRCIVILDRDRVSYPDSDAFERAIVAAASVVTSAERSGLTTRFVTPGLDLRGPEVANHTLHALAPIEIGGPLGEIERDPAEGLGLVVVVTGSPRSSGWAATDRVSDPTLTRIGVFTAEGGDARRAVDAGTLARFRQSWGELTGVRESVRR